MPVSSGIAPLPGSEPYAIALTPSAASTGVRRPPSWLSPLAGLLLVAATIHYVDAGALLARVSQLRVGYILLGGALAFPQLLCLAARWRLTAAQLGVQLTQERALREYGLSMLLNQLLPFGVAGDAIRVLRHARGATRAPAAAEACSSVAHRARNARDTTHAAGAAEACSWGATSAHKARDANHAACSGAICARNADNAKQPAAARDAGANAAAAQAAKLANAHLRDHPASAAVSGGSAYSTALYGVLLERMMGQLVVIVWALAALPLWFGSAGAWLAGSGFAAMALLALALRRVAVPAALSGRPRFARAVLRLAAAVQRLLASPRFLFAQFWLSTAVVLGLVAQLYCALCSLGLSLSLAQAMQIFPWMLLSMTLPISFAGFGPREAVTAQLYRALHLSAADGAAFAMATGAVILCTSLPCLFLVLSLPRTSAERTP